MITVWLAAGLLACGGGGTNQPDHPTGVGDSHTTGDSDTSDDLDAVPEGAIDEPVAKAMPDAGAAAVEEPDDDTDVKPPVDPNAPAVTFRLKNTADEDLVFSMDRGWQPIIFAWYGVKPNAVPIIMFPKYCTAACDSDEPCPHCEEPTKTQEIKAAEKREIVAPGKTLDVPWDGQVFVYTKKKCSCYSTAPVPEETYVVKACGFRITKTAKSSSKYQCVEGAMKFPADGPQVVELDFPKP